MRVKLIELMAFVVIILNCVSCGQPANNSEKVSSKSESDIQVKLEKLKLAAEEERKRAAEEKRKQAAKMRYESETEKKQKSEQISRDEMSEFSETYDKGNSDFSVIRTYFATDRNSTMSRNPDKFFGDSRSSVKYGFVDVSIPRIHKKANIERPSILKLDFYESRKKHVVLYEPMIVSQQDFITMINRRLKDSHSKSAFIFVHGYNVTFSGAARRTAQIAHDIQFDGAPVFYSWPSKGDAIPYTVDSTNVAWTQPNFKNFLDDFLERSDVDSVFLIAHSMGSRAVTGALSALCDVQNRYKKIKEIILAAPDIDASVFVRDIVPALKRHSFKITLYASSNDKALQGSHIVNGEIRAGDSSGRLITVLGVDTIDASNVKTDFIGHSFYGDSISVVNDIYYLIKQRQRVETRCGLVSKSTTDGDIYWTFEPVSNCSGINI
jgi:esterase/lipase superfamily enzyme